MRIKMIISYDGTDFSGYQIQPDARTVQEELETALSRLHKGRQVKVTASGRTDAKVHARGQVLHFDTPLGIPMDRWPKALNALLPKDIKVLEAAEAAKDFHARFDACGKEYRYVIDRSPVQDVFLRNYAYHYPYALNLEAMKSASEQFIGTHDFTAFCSAKTEVEDRVRTIHSIRFIEEGERMTMCIQGSGFLYNMVRIIMGTLLNAGIGLTKPEEISEMILSMDRTKTGKTAPGHGLYLWKVFYDN
ncbi:tRNA pseudouridine(38-40) synthase TruA [Bacillus sp. FJAT-42376]|uniref:tRNA pseudouridine(38-40) synthase TruA n=1 Tax=Bacillus sp. FJAT-42376 TaxID=2014076 RepID=UPI000F4E7EDD|nr:tRNA pseudouridine(38-40) synthase TruA [Bacillus sp. FJAT-42376]AZB41286.1 tRNA pseudouridine(38-40) synthase TruA [Bacillus sp. FJAT-42376]